VTETDPIRVIDRDGKEGAVVELIQHPNTPLIHREARRARATHRHGAIWTISRNRIDTLRQYLSGAIERIEAGITGGGIPDGLHGAYTVTGGDGRWRISCPKPYVPRLRGIGAVWDAGAFHLPYTEFNLLQDLIEESRDAAERARALEWPRIDQIDIQTRADGTVSIRSPYREDLRDAMRAIPTARWNAGAREWTIQPRYRIALRRALIKLSGA